MAKDTTIDGYYLNSSEAWINAVLTLDEAKNRIELLKKEYQKYFGNVNYYYTPEDNYVDKSLKGKYCIFSYGDSEGTADSDI